ncbi:MAG: hypothetical protein SFW35_03465 [Chitinophagales bacterium]|nr:hypothetical protein [Chitinophagales bacterium]
MKNLRIYRFTKCLFAFILISSLLSCEEEEINTGYNDTPVVEAYLVPGTQATIKVSLQVEANTTETAIKTIDTLHPTIIHEGLIYYLNPIGGGVYIADTSLTINEGHTYRLYFIFNGDTVNSETTVPSKPTEFKLSATTMEIPKIDLDAGFPSELPEFPEPIDVTWSNPDQSYYLILAQNTSTNPEPVFDNPDSLTNPPTFRIEPTKAGSYELNSQQFSYFGNYDIILYHINPEYAGLYDESGNSSQNLRQASTNIINGQGIFTAIHSDTLKLRVIKQ